MSRPRPEPAPARERVVQKPGKTRPDAQSLAVKVKAVKTSAFPAYQPHFDDCEDPHFKCLVRTGTRTVQISPFGLDTAQCTTMASDDLEGKKATRFVAFDAAVVNATQGVPSVGSVALGLHDDDDDDGVSGAEGLTKTRCMMSVWSSGGRSRGRSGGVEGAVKQGRGTGDVLGWAGRHVLNVIADVDDYI
ncbi:GL12296 [Drosophila persimilis]|uniref:GL12296 n=1 Tax=Drosophila persimilis TaxID=7234 RepID=B4GM85_DROPE|nr:GL12296 [Drosophila persimilis]